MFYIYKKNLNTGRSSFFMKTGNKKVAESRVREMNADSLFDDEFYYISEESPEDE